MALVLPNEVSPRPAIFLERATMKPPGPPLLRALFSPHLPLNSSDERARSIGCESDPTDELGRSVYLWTLIRLVDVWVDEGNECGSAAHEQIVRVCNRGRVPLPQLLKLPPASTSTAGIAGRGVGTDAGTTVPLKVAAGTGRELDSGSVLAPLMEKLMETGHLEEFVEQVML